MTRHFVMAVALLTGVTSSSAVAQQFLSSRVMTFRFGVETDFANSTRLDNHHLDIALPYRAGGSFEGRIRSDNFPGLLDPMTYHLFANANTRRTQPSNPVFSFTGVAPGQPIWIMPQNLTGGQIYLGVSAEAMSGSDAAQVQAWNPQDPRAGANNADRWIQIMLIDVRRPAAAPNANFALWSTSGTGNATAFMTTSNGIGDDDVYHIRTGGHTHYNWGFGATGLWEVDLQVRTFTTLNWLKGDADLDGDVDLVDFNTLVANQNRRDDWFRGDFTGDGRINIEDFFELQANFGVGTNLTQADLFRALTQTPLVVPEPSTLAFVLLGALSLRRTRLAENSANRSRTESPRA